MFFPAAEYPTPEMETALGRLGVRCRQLPSLSPPGGLPARAHVEAHLAGFTLKIAALVLSSFREVRLCACRCWVDMEIRCAVR